jgi:hypothetical protein
MIDASEDPLPSITVVLVGIFQLNAPPQLEP